jgi:hypothetical protein
LADQQSPKPKALEREARRLERLCKLRLVEQPPPEKRSTPPPFRYEPKDAA